MRGEGEREGREPEGAPSPAPGRPSFSAAAPQAGGNSEARSSRIADRKAAAAACAAQGTRDGRMGGWGRWGDGGVERARFRIAPRAARGGRALAAPAPAACRGGGYIVCPLDCSSFRDWQVSRVWAGPEAPTFGSPACDSLAWVVLGELCTQPPTPRRLPGGAFVPPSRVMVTIKCICGLPNTGPSDVNCLRLAC